MSEDPSWQYEPTSESAKPVTLTFDELHAEALRRGYTLVPQHGEGTVAGTGGDPGSMVNQFGHPLTPPQDAKPVISSPDKPSIALLAERLHNACYSLGVADERYTSDYQVKKASDKAEAVKAELLAAVAAAIDAAAIAQTADARDAQILKLLGEMEGRAKVQWENQEHASGQMYAIRELRAAIAAIQREGVKHESWCCTLQECDCGAAEQQEGK